MIGLQQMVIFVTVADMKGFAYAAGKLHMTQSAVSKAIAKLERDLGFKLFSRSTRYLELTEAGKVLYEIGKSFCPHSRTAIEKQRVWQRSRRIFCGLD